MTKREKIAIISASGLLLVLSLLFQFTSFEMTEGWEMLFGVFIILPIGLMIATDPER